MVNVPSYKAQVEIWGNVRVPTIGYNHLWRFYCSRRRDSVMEFFYLSESERRLIEPMLYRRERTLYKSEKELQLLLNHEKDFFTGTSHEQDSIKDVIRYWEQKGDFDKTFLYFSPAED